MDHPRQPSRRLGQRRAAIRSAACRRNSKRRVHWANCASRAGSRSGRSSTRRGTAKNRAFSDRPSGSRRTRRICGSTPSRTSTPTATAAASSTMQGSHTLERFLNGVARDVSDPESDVSVLKRRQAFAVARGPADERQGGARAGRLPHRCARIGIGLHAVRPARRHRVDQPQLRRRGSRTASTTRSTTTSTSSRTSSTPTSRTDARSRRPSARLSSDSPTRTSCRWSSRIWRTPCRSTGASSRICSAGSRTIFANAIGRSRTASSRRCAIRGRRCRFRRSETVPPAINFAPFDNAAAALTDAARRYDKALRSRAREGHGQSDGARRAQCEASSGRNPADRQRRPVPTAVVPAPDLRAGFYTGYGVKTIPGVREGIEDGRYADAEKEVSRVASALTRLTSLIDSASSDLENLR